jgi:hypothetical protein
MRSMRRKLTTTGDESVHEALDRLDDIYIANAQIASDTVREAEAVSWSEGLFGDVSGLPD